MTEKEKKGLVDKHLELVLSKNHTINLTSITNKQKAQILHIEDSLTSLKFINNISNGKLVDLGSGAGYPGIPLSIYSGRQTTLIESITKKADCLQYFINKLNLNNQISVINDRIENYSKENRNKFQIATARAVSSISSILELASPLLKIDGFMICYKGANIKEEINEANAISDKIGFINISRWEYILSDNKTKHQIIVYKKINESKISLPRRVGMAQKKALI